MERNRLAAGALITLTLAAALQPAAVRADVHFGGDVTIATDYLFYGVSQTMSAPAIQGTIEFESDNGWYGYLWASNVDFTPAGTTDDGAETEINAELGYSFSLGERVSASLGGVYYAFPGTLPGYEYDYGDWLGSLILDDRHHIAVGFSDNVFGSRESGTVVLAGTNFNVNEHIAIDAEVGHYDLDNAYGYSYQFADIGASGEVEQVSWRLGYIVTGGDDTELFEASTVGSRFVLSLSFQF